MDVQCNGKAFLCYNFLSRVRDSPEQVHCSVERDLRAGNRKFLETSGSWFVNYQKASTQILTQYLLNLMRDLEVPF